MDRQNQQPRKLEEGFKNALLQAWLDMYESGLTHEQIWESVKVREVTEDPRPPGKVPVIECPYPPKKLVHERI